MPTETINDNPFCDVDLMPLAETDSKYSVVRLKDGETNAFVPIASRGAIHGAGYRLVPNTYVVQLTKDVLTRTGEAFRPMPGYEGSKSSNITWDGKKFAMAWYLPEVGDTVNGDPEDRLMLGVRALNSYDGSYKIGMEFFAMRMLCLNQFHSSNMLGSFTYRHFDTGDRTLDADIGDAVEQIGNQAEQFTRCLPRLRQLQKAEVPLTSDYLAIGGALQKMKPAWPASYDAQVNAELRGEGITNQLGATLQASALRPTADPRTLWGILNAFTAVTTHAIGGFRGVELSRVVTDYILSRAAAIAA